MTFGSVRTALESYVREIADQGGALPLLNPGLTEGELRAIEIRHDVRLPEDVQAIWSWANGTAETEPGFKGETCFANEMFFPNLDRAIQDGELMVEIAEIAGEARAGVDRWISLGLSKRSLVIDATDPTVDHAETYILAHGEGIWTTRHITVTQRINVWVEALRRGFWHYRGGVLDSDEDALRASDISDML